MYKGTVTILYYDDKIELTIYNPEQHSIILDERRLANLNYDIADILMKIAQQKK